MKFRHVVWGRNKKYATTAMINSSPAPINRISGKRELFLFIGTGSAIRGGWEAGCPKVSGAGLANILVYSPGPCGAMFCAGVVGYCVTGRSVLNTCVALAEGFGGGAAGASGGGAEGIESRPKICVNSPAPFGAEGGGVSGAIGWPPAGADGDIGPSKKRVNSPEDGFAAGGVGGPEGRCACNICVNSPGRSPDCA
jgi:hypothetical protein